ncbi:hypothetical protein ID866_4490 [Astraeus odoratus]|nr:hypothetical protein ID866_4490 [Astraeus odoratus]
MRRRGDSYVNATQILKVAGIEKGRRTKILEKEILPGKHEIVQGGYGKYQGTWIPLDRGREIAARYGVAPLLAPLFDFTPNSHSLGSLPATNNTASPRPLSAASSFPTLGASPTYPQASLAPPPILPGSALRLLNQGRAQGLFTPTTSSVVPSRSGGYPPAVYQSNYIQSPGVSSPSSIQQSLKRTRSDSEVTPAGQAVPHSFTAQRSNQTLLGAPADIQMSDRSRPPSEEDGPSPNKRARTELTPSALDASQDSTVSSQSAVHPLTRHISSMNVSSPKLQSQNSSSRAPSVGTSANGKMVNGTDGDGLAPRFSTRPGIIRDSSILKDPRRAQLIAAICRQDDPAPVFELLRELTADPSIPVQVDTVLDDKGHTALHLAASMARQNIMEQLVVAGADIHRGNFAGETPLIRASIDTHNFDRQSFHIVVASLHSSLRTLDTSRKSVLHHIMYLAGIQGRAVCARYYLDQIFLWIAQHQGGDFRSMVDLQDEHGDTALNIAARGLSAEFSAEIKAKQDSLDVTQAHLRAATRELSEQRRQIQIWQSRCAELDQVHQRIRNLEKAIADEDSFDWTGRTDLAGKDGRETAGPAFQWRGSNSTMVGVGGSMDIPFAVEIEPPVPTADTPPNLIRLRRLKMWQVRMEELMEARLKSLQGASAEKEYQCKRIVALCTGIPIDKVEDMLENLVVAMESEAQVVDIVRVTGFMQKVRDGII